jgi:hypothetical protein
VDSPGKNRSPLWLRRALTDFSDTALSKRKRAKKSSGFCTTNLVAFGSKDDFIRVATTSWTAVWMRPAVKGEELRLEAAISQRGG